MTKKSQERAEQMFEFLKKALYGSDTYDRVSVKRSNGPGFNHFLKSGDLSTVLMLMPQNYTKQDFSRIMGLLENKGYENTIFVPLKDGKQFFRSATFTHQTELKSAEYKKDLSLKNYDSQARKRIILLRPEELLIKNNKQEIIYYQPESQRLEEKLIKHEFTPVIFDYTHIDPQRRAFFPSQEISKRDFLWLPNKKEEHDSGIYFKNNKIYSN